MIDDHGCIFLDCRKHGSDQSRKHSIAGDWSEFCGTAGVADTDICRRWHISHLNGSTGMISFSHLACLSCLFSLIPLDTSHPVTSFSAVDVWTCLYLFLNVYYVSSRDSLKGTLQVLFPLLHADDPKHIVLLYQTKKIIITIFNLDLWWDRCQTCQVCAWYCLL